MKKSRIVFICLGVLALVLLTGFGFFWWFTIQNTWFIAEPWWLRKGRFARAAERSQSLINAIEDYTGKNGKPPESLEVLVPKYFRSVPKPGVMKASDFIYTAFTNAGYHEYWWDLGSHEAQATIFPTKHREDDLNHAILVIVFDRERRVSYVEIARMPTNYLKAPFSADQWNKKEKRIWLVDSLLQDKNFKGQGTNEVVSLLGPPDGEGAYWETPWELKVKCTSYWGLDSFFYWPTGNYPLSIYGGGTELIKSWAYVHE